MSVVVSEDTARLSVSPISISEAIRRAEIEIQLRDNRRYTTGLQNIDKHLKYLLPGEFVVVGARQGEGKTALAEMIAMDNGQQGHKVLFASLEMTCESVVNRMIARMMQKDLEMVEFLQAVHDPQYVAARDTLDGANLHFWRQPRGRQPSIDGIVEAWKETQSRILIVDYSRRIQGWLRSPEYAGRIVQTLSEFAKMTRVTTILLSQLGRDYQGKRPDASSPQDTSLLEQECDKMILLWRPFKDKPECEDNIAEVILAKNRRGREGRLHVGWEGYCGKLYESYWPAGAPCCVKRKPASDGGF